MSDKSAPYISFVSYAHQDNHASDDGITSLANKLRNEVNLLSGADDFDIWIDREDIGWGESWKTRIDEGLVGSSFLIPFITPRFFVRNECIREYRKFLDIEKQSNRQDLILAVLYVDPDWDDLLARNDLPLGAKQVIEVVRGRQWEDWTELRHRPDSRVIGATAGRLREAIKRTQSDRDQALAPEEPSANSMVVDPNRVGCFETIQMAIDAAKPGAEIFIREGKYVESIELNRPVAIRAADPEKMPIVEWDTRVVRSTCFGGSVLNIEFRSLTSDELPVFLVEDGQLGIEGCVLSGGHDGIVVCSGATANLREVSIVDSCGYGLRVGEQATLLGESIDVSGHSIAGVCGSMGSKITITGSSIANNGFGVFLYFDGEWNIDMGQVHDNLLGEVSQSSGG